MAGGVGEGAIPLSVGYSEIMHVAQGTVFAQVLPSVMIGSLSAILFSGLLSWLGEKKPHLTGNGMLQPAHHTEGGGLKEEIPNAPDVNTVAAAAITAISLYLVGLLCHRLLGLPAPVAMLFVAVFIKVFRFVSPNLQGGGLYAVAAGLSKDLDFLGSEGSRVLPVFITLDPRRDKPAPTGHYAESAIHVL
jgi:malate:Na+ symporter